MIRRFKKITAYMVLTAFAMSTVVLSLPKGAYALDQVPEVNINQPVNGLYISSGPLFVAGTASDDGTVDSVDLQMLDVDTGEYWSQALTSWVGSETNNPVAGPTFDAWGEILSPAVTNDHAYTLKAIATDNSAQTSETSVSLVGDTEAPTLAVTSHADGDAINNVTLQGTATDVSGVSKVEIKRQGDATWSLASGTTSWSYDFSAPALDAEGTAYVFEIRAHDKATGTNIGLPMLFTLVKDSVAPEVGETIHPENSTVAFESTVVFAGVSEQDALMKLQINSDPYVAEQTADATGNWRFEVPGSELGAGVHTVAITATDKAGNASTRHMTFTISEQVVAVAEETTPPAVLSTPTYKPTLAVATTHVGVPAPANSTAEEDEDEDEKLAEGNVETGTGDSEESETSPWQTIITVIAILIIAIGVGTVGYYGYEWWLSRDAVPASSVAKKPVKKEEVTSSNENKQATKAKSKKKGSRSRRSSTRW